MKGLTYMDKQFLSEAIKYKMIMLILFSSIFLTGCWDRREVFDMAIVLGTAIDKTDDGQIEVSIQVLIPQSIGGSSESGGQGGNKEIVMVKNGKGKTISDATSNLEMQLSRNIFWGHCKMYIFSENFAKENGIRKELEYLIRHPKPRERAYLYIAKGLAKDMLEVTPDLELYVGEGMRRLVEKQIVVKKTIKDVEEMLTSDTKSIILPYMYIEKSEKGEASIVITEASIFNRDKMVGVINNDAMRGVLWLRNEVKINSITVPLKEREYISVRVTSGKTSLKPKIINGNWRMDINVQIKCEVTQNGTNLNVFDPRIVATLEEELEKATRKKIEGALQAVQQDLKVDVIGFGEAFHRKYPKDWKQAESDWEYYFSNIKTKTKVKATVLRSGLTTSSSSLK
jgi:spore germination protein KC